MQAALVSCRFVHDASTLMLFGACLYRAVLARSWPVPGLDHLDRQLRRPLLIAALLALASAAALLLLVAGSMGEGWQDTIDPATVTAVLTATSFGQVWRWRLGLALVLVLSVLLRCGRASGTTLGLAAVLLASLALTGHAVRESGSAGLLHRADDALHLLAAGAWLGGLLPLALLLRDAKGQAAGEGVVVALRRFSGLGYVAVALVLVTGTLNAAFLVGSAAALTGTLYGRVLLAKLALVAVMLGLALRNRFVLLPREPADRTGSLRRLEHSVVVEIGVGAAILAVVSLLGTLPPADVMPSG